MTECGDNSDCKSRIIRCSNMQTSVPRLLLRCSAILGLIVSAQAKITGELTVIFACKIDIWFVVVDSECFAFVKR